MALQESFTNTQFAPVSASTTRSPPFLSLSRRIRSTPFTARVKDAGVAAYTVYNHMLLATSFQSPEEDYWHLYEHVQLWDVSCQRQIELAGPDAGRLLQMMTPRDVTSKFDIGQCKYAPLVDVDGGLINDPVIIRVAENRYWLSIADSDVLLWAKGLATGFGLDVDVSEPDVYPLAVQGPKAEDLMADVFGEEVRDIRFFRSAHLEFQGIKFWVARSGWSKQGGFEIYLDVPAMAGNLWDALWQAGEKYNVRAGGPNLIERIESGLLSFGNDMTRMNTPLECGLDKFCALDSDIEFLGKAALTAQRAAGIKRKLVGLVIDGAPIPACERPWTVFADGTPIGNITSAAYSPRHGTNLAFAMIECGEPGTCAGVVRYDNVSVDVPDGNARTADIQELPFAFPLR